LDCGSEDAKSGDDCQSAPGPNANRHRKLLKWLLAAGSDLRAKSHRDVRDAVALEFSKTGRIVGAQECAHRGHEVHNLGRRGDMADNDLSSPKRCLS
jgi:hypothetical protein